MKCFQCEEEFKEDELITPEFNDEIKLCSECYDLIVNCNKNQLNNLT